MAGMTTGGYIQSLRTTDAAIMIRIELPMHVTVSQVRTRVRSARGHTGPAAGGLKMSPVVLAMQLLLVAQRYAKHRRAPPTTAARAAQEEYCVADSI